MQKQANSSQMFEQGDVCWFPHTEWYFLTRCKVFFTIQSYSLQVSLLMQGGTVYVKKLVKKIIFCPRFSNFFVKNSLKIGLFQNVRNLEKRHVQVSEPSNYPHSQDWRCSQTSMHET